jgi:hypothetical protein
MTWGQDNGPPAWRYVLPLQMDQIAFLLTPNLSATRA